jgi:hypothetical protein
MERVPQDCINPLGSEEREVIKKCSGPRSIAYQHPEPNACMATGCTMIDAPLGECKEARCAYVYQRERREDWERRQRERTEAAAGRSEAGRSRWQPCGRRS